MDKLGINLPSFLFQLLNFGILFLILGKFVFPAFLRMLDERKKRIQESLENADKIKVELEEIETKRRTEMAKIQQETLNTMRLAREEAEKIKHGIEEQAKEKARQIVTAAEQEIEKKKEEMLREFSASAGELAVMIAKKIIKHEMVSTDKNSIMSDSLDEFLRMYKGEQLQ